MGLGGGVMSGGNDRGHLDESVGVCKSYYDNQRVHMSSEQKIN